LILIRAAVAAGRTYKLATPAAVTVNSNALGVTGLEESVNGCRELMLAKVGVLTVAMNMLLAVLVEVRAIKHVPLAEVRAKNNPLVFNY
jgi:hypothetical protein